MTRRWPVSLFLAGLLLGVLAVLVTPAAGPARAQQPTQKEMRDEARAFGRSLIPRARTEATAQPDADRIPQFTSNPSQQTYYSSPSALEAAAMAQAPSHPGYQSVQQSIGSRATFDPQEIRDATSLGRAIQADPNSYVSGFSADGQLGVCRPLPPGEASPGRYEQSCDSGYAVTPSTHSCSIPLEVTATRSYRYQCSILDGTCAPFAGCSFVDTIPGPCLVTPGPDGWCPEPGEPLRVYECAGPVAGQTPTWIGPPVITESRNETGCASWAGNPECQSQAEVCTDSDPVTRTIDGIPVTRPCWAWSRTYQCNGMSQMSDCSQLEGLGCTFLRENCLSEDTPCMNVERVYSCPIPPVPSQSGEICDGDIFCLNGECDQIDREPNTDFKDAVVALNAIAQAGKEFDPDNLTVFRGEAMSCTKTIFGLTNCCVPRGFPLLGGCNAGDAALKERREKGECTYVGTWCSSRFLGVCLQRRERHCCFLSKISRILQEQGRPQIGKAWGAPRDEQCLGFTIAEFQQLDLSRMDFSEVYAEFTEAARLPEELATVTDMQTKITNYFNANR
ncbi:MAG: hypothetical protein B7Y35_07390 [Sphingomonadales bacterium 28-64-96]|nr:MAG: hypothetical protein B7Y35_07390 [Sphingomonadales bacterium 28-64-96]